MNSCVWLLDGLNSIMTGSQIIADRLHVLQAAFAISFFVTRLLIGPAVTYYTLQSPTSPGIVKVRKLYVSCDLAAGVLYEQLLTKSSTCDKHQPKLAGKGRLHGRAYVASFLYRLEV